MSDFFLNIMLVGLLGGAGIWLQARGGRRKAQDVLYDLSEVTDSVKENLKKLDALVNVTDASQQRATLALPLFAAAVLAGIKNIFLPGSLPGTLAWALVGFAGAYLFQGSRGQAKQKEEAQAVEFYLPIVMERLVMAVQAGLDIIPALKAIVELDRSASGAKTGAQSDPVGRILKTVVDLAEAGLGFDQALKAVAAKSKSLALKHAFIHLAVAHQEGGEIVAPLKELSDATQQYYQDTVEEQIAKLPVKATLPLLCTFAGLITCFVTSPLVQVLKMTAKAMPK